MKGIYPKRGRLYFRVKVLGKWKGIATEFTVGQERAAEAMLEKFRVQLAAGADVGAGLGPATVASFFDRWIKSREQQVFTWKNDRGVMKHHVLATLGQLRLDAVRPKHLVDLVASWRARTGEERMAPKSIYNAYSTLSAFFRDAALEDLVPSSPCVLTKRQLGPKVDGDPEWRKTAVYSQAELELLISDTRLPLDRRIYYALCGVAALRYGEASGLLWRNCGVQPETPPLGMLYVAFSYDRPLPKGDVCRPVPIHPALAALLAEWKLGGWERAFGRKPTDDDLVVPLPADAVSKHGRWRQKAWVRGGLKRDLETLGLRHRRGHDLRRAFISLARSNGAQKDILARATHKPPREVIEGYTTFEWPVVCREVLKLPVQLRRDGKVIALPIAAAANGESATAFATASDNSAFEQGVSQWPSPDSNRRGEQRGGAGDQEQQGNPDGYATSEASSGGEDVETDEVAGSTVAKALGDLLALGSAGLDPRHPTAVRAATVLKNRRGWRR